MSDKLTGEDLEKALKDRGLPSTGSADEKRAAVQAHDEAAGQAAAAGDNPTVTRLDSDVTKPSTTAPGDGPADTTDPTEEASTVGGDKQAAAKAGHLTVNAAVPVEPVNKRARSSKSKDRVEEFEATRPDGTSVTVVRNIETGESKVS